MIDWTTRSITFQLDLQKRNNPSKTLSVITISKKLLSNTIVSSPEFTTISHPHIAIIVA